MRKVSAGLFISLDGVVESPSEWAYPHLNDEAMGAINEGLPQADAILLGRRTYLEFAELWPGREGPMGDFLNGTPKHVVSGTLDTLEWGPATLLEGDLAEALAELKRQPGRNIQVPGSPRLVGSLLRDGLLDELALMAVPVVVGSGARLFDGIADRIDLELVESRAFGDVLSTTYRTVLDRSH
jgi:dihydrofolate reductase